MRFESSIKYQQWTLDARGLKPKSTTVAVCATLKQWLWQVRKALDLYNKRTSCNDLIYIFFLTKNHLDVGETDEQK
jgi:hypothetical protein